MEHSISWPKALAAIFIGCVVGLIVAAELDWMWPIGAVAGGIVGWVMYAPIELVVEISKAVAHYRTRMRLARTTRQKRTAEEVVKSRMNRWFAIYIASTLATVSMLMIVGDIAFNNLCPSGNNEVLQLMYFLVLLSLYIGYLVRWVTFSADNIPTGIARFSNPQETIRIMRKGIFYFNPLTPPIHTAIVIGYCLYWLVAKWRKWIIPPLGFVARALVAINSHGRMFCLTMVAGGVVYGHLWMEGNIMLAASVAAIAALPVHYGLKLLFRLLPRQIQHTLLARGH